MALYSNGSPQPTSAANSPPKTVNGRGIKRRQLSRFQRVLWAAGCITGAVLLRPSIEQACQLFDVPKELVRKHLRARNGNGVRLRSNGHAETLADHIARSSAAERLEAARALGVNQVWDEMVLPIIAAERAATEANSTA